MIPFIQVIVDAEFFISNVYSYIFLSVVTKPDTNTIRSRLFSNNINYTGHGFTSVQYGPSAFNHLTALNAVCRTLIQIVLAPPGNRITVEQDQCTMIHAADNGLINHGTHRGTILAK